MAVGGHVGGEGVGSGGACRVGFLLFSTLAEVTRLGDDFFLPED